MTGSGPAAATIGAAASSVNALPMTTDFNSAFKSMTFSLNNFRIWSVYE